MASGPFQDNDDAGTTGIHNVARYQIQKKIGAGSNGVVYLGIDPYIQRKVAIKLSQPTSDKSRSRFFVEAQSAGRLNHPNIVSIYDTGVHDEYCYITMEYVDGDTLDTHCRGEKRLPVTRIMEIMFSLCDALDYAHKENVIHRDIKPSNIMIHETGQVKITDFGIAQLTEKTTELGVWGTPSYMSPEQLRDDPLGFTSDIFSLGCVLYELLTGQLAFSGENSFTVMYKITSEDPPPVTTVRKDLPKVFDHIVGKALAKEINERYQTCMELAYDLRVAVRGMTETTNGEKAKDVIDYLQHIPFFHNFTKSQLSELFTACSMIKVLKDKVIVTEGDINDTLYIILSGRVRVIKDGQIIAKIGIGQCFGEMSYLCGSARAASVVADTDCILMKVSATILDRAPESIQLLFFKNFAITLVRRLSKGSG
jgi:serine/threonine protein kinase